MTAYDTAILATSGLVSYWPLSESSGNAIDLKGGYNGVWTGTPTRNVSLGFADGDVGVTLSGSQYASVAHNAAFDFGTGDYSIEAWFMGGIDPPTNSEFILGFGTPGAGGDGYEMFLGDGGKYATSRIDSTYAQTITGAWADWNLHYICATMSRAGNGIFYVDGASNNSRSIAADSAQSVSASTSLFLGGANASAGRLNRSFAKVALYNVALSSGTVAAHYAAKTSVTSVVVDDPFGRMGFFGL